MSPVNTPHSSKIPQFVFLLSCVAIVFAIGVAVGRYRAFPYPILEHGKESLDAALSAAAVAAGLRPTEHAVPSRYDGTGVTINRQNATAPGLTLLVGYFEGRNELRLIRHDGTIVNRWTPSFARAFPNADHIEPRSLVPNGESNVEIHGAAALSDGAVVFNYDGKGTIKLDRCGVEQWTVRRMTHHAVFAAADGGFWIPSFRYVAGPSRFAALAPPYLEPTVLKVNAGGGIEQEVSLLDIFFRNNLEALLFANGLKGIALANKYEGTTLPNDIVHLNDVEELSGPMTAAFPQFRPGSLLLSMRDYNLVMVVEPKTLAVAWYQVGPWIGQHDPDFLANGRISVFDNANDDTERGTILGGSRIMEIEPTTRKVDVTFGRSPAPGSFFTDVMGKHQRIGANILITEARAGRVFEVDGNREIVWEFINRVDAETVNTVTGAVRYPTDFFTVADWSCK